MGLSVILYETAYSHLGDLEIPVYFIFFYILHFAFISNVFIMNTVNSCVPFNFRKCFRSLNFCLLFYYYIRSHSYRSFHTYFYMPFDFL